MGRRRRAPDGPPRIVPRMVAGPPTPPSEQSSPPPLTPSPPSSPREAGLKAADLLPDTPEGTPPATKQGCGADARARGTGGGGAGGGGCSGRVGRPACDAEVDDPAGGAAADNLAPAVDGDWVDIEMFPDFQQWSAMKKANKKENETTTPPESSGDELRGGRKRRKMPSPCDTQSARATAALPSSSSEDLETHAGAGPPAVGLNVGSVVEGVVPVGVRRSQRNRTSRRDVQG